MRREAAGVAFEEVGVTDTGPGSAAHVPVMRGEVVEWLRPRPGARLADCTVGGGGHAEALLEASAPEGVVIGLDWDSRALAAAGARLARFGARFHPVHASYTRLPEVLAELGWSGLDGVLLDLGVSSLQLDDPERGLSFSRTGPLDMRLDRTRSLTADEIVNCWSEAEIARILRRYGEERRARRVARAIVAARRPRIATTSELAAVVERAVGRSRAARRRIHPATRTFQALRLAVNGELEELETFMREAWRWLAPGGRIVVISYHSLEDRLVKEALRRWAADCLCPPGLPACRCGWKRRARVLTERPLRPTRAEVEANPRARSARLRAAERLHGAPGAAA